jgi:hypothetical protein
MLAGAMEIYNNGSHGVTNPSIKARNAASPSTLPRPGHNHRFIPIPGLTQFQSPQLPKCRFGWMLDAASAFNSFSTIDLPLESFLSVYSNNNIKHFADRNVKKGQGTVKRFYVMVTKSRIDNPNNAPGTTLATPQGEPLRP